MSYIWQSTDVRAEWPPFSAQRFYMHVVCLFVYLLFCLFVVFFFLVFFVVVVVVLFFCCCFLFFGGFFVFVCVCVCVFFFNCIIYSFLLLKLYTVTLSRNLPARNPREGVGCCCEYQKERRERKNEIVALPRAFS